MTIIERIGIFLDDQINPLLVKELRQAVRGRLFTGFLLLFLFLQTFVLFMALDTGIRSEPLRLGWNVFYSLFEVLVAITMGIMPLIMGYHLFQDFRPGEQDLFRITTLTPRQIIHGKFLGTWVITAMFYATHLPLAILTVYLRGVDFPTILVILAGGFLFTGLIYILVILAVVGPAQEHSAAGVLFGGAWMLYMVNMIFQEFIQLIHQHGFSGGFSGLFANYGAGGLVMIFSAGLVYEWAVSRVTPAPANKSLGSRRFITLFSLATLALAIWRTMGSSSAIALEFWLAFQGLIVMFSFPSAATERLEPGRRVLGEISQFRLGRPGAFLFSTGVAGGVAWTAFHAMLMLGVFFGYEAFGTSWYPAFSGYFKDNWLPQLEVGILFGWNFGLTGFFLRRLSISAGLSDEYGSHFSVGMFILTGLVPFFVVAVFLNQLIDPPDFAFISPFMIGDRRYQSTILQVQATWAAFTLLMNAGWLWQKWLEFVPPAPAAQEA